MIALRKQAHMGLSAGRAGMALAGLVALLASAGLTAARQTPPGAVQGAELERQVVEASHAWFQAVTTGDVEALQSIETDDFVSIQLLPPGVSIVTKAAQIEALRKNGPGGQKLQLRRDLTGIRVRAYGSVAILTAAGTFRGQNAAGGSFAGQALTTEVWINDAGRWRLAHFQPTAVPARK